MDEVSEIRQRRKAEDDSTSYPTRSLGKRLEKLDFYPKIGDDYVIKTESGGYGGWSVDELMCSFCVICNSYDRSLYRRTLHIPFSSARREDHAGPNAEREDGHQL